MAANEFEKKVKKIVSEFKLHPSNEVWQNVEKRIRETKRKRRVIFFILFLAMGLTMGTYGLYHYSIKPGTHPIAAASKTNQTSKQKRSIPTGSEKNGNGDQLQIITSAKENSDDANKNVASKQSSVETRQRNKKPNEPLAIKRKETPAKKSFAFSEPGNKSKKQITNNTNESETERNYSSPLQNQGEKGIPPNNETGSVNLKNQGESGQTHADATLDSATTFESKEKIQTEEISESKKEAKKPTNHTNWKWGINFSAGASTIAQDILPFTTDKSYNGISYGSPGTASGGGGRVINPASSSKPSFSFKAGVILKKDFTKRSSLSIGINYAYLADKIKVGTRVDSLVVVARQNMAPYFFSSAPTSYSTSSKKEYTDHFHFIELPVIYNWRITGNTDHFLALNAGVSAAYLFSTHALVYDTTAGGIYYHTNELFAKTHFNLLTGLSYHFSPGKNFEWILGPEVSFDLTKTFKSELDERKYFIYTGIKANIFFESKKKK